MLLYALFLCREESIKALGNPPANLQNPVEVEKAFFEKSKNLVRDAVLCVVCCHS